MKNVIINARPTNLVNYENISSDNNHNVYLESTSKSDCLSSLIRDSQLVYYSFGVQNESEQQKPVGENPASVASISPFAGNL